MNRPTPARIISPAAEDQIDLQEPELASTPNGARGQNSLPGYLATPPIFWGYLKVVIPCL
jgi:hypothetical protein